MNEELKKAIEQFNTALAEFKGANDERFRQIEAKGSVSAELESKIEKISADLVAAEKKVDDIKTENEVMAKTMANLEAQGLNKADKKDPNKVYSSLGEQLIDVARASNPDLSSSARNEAISKLSKVRAATGASEGVPADGGFLVQQDFGGLLAQSAVETGMLSRRCFRIPISADANGYKANVLDEPSRLNGSRFGGIQVYHANEAGSVTATKPKFRQLSLELHKLMGLMYATDELLRDAAAFTATVNRWFPMEFGFKLDDMILNGNGAGQGLGVLNSGALISVDKESGQAADTIVFDNIIEMDSRLIESSESSALYLINREAKPQLAKMYLPIGTGGEAVYLPMNGAAGRPTNQLYGRPTLTMEQCSALGDVGDILLFDPNEVIFIDKGGIQAAISIHVQFIYDEQTFRWSYRYDCQPIKNRPVTPYKGTKSLSPFVAVAARA